MSVIRRIEVINFLNHQKESPDWNPWYRHEVIIFDGHSGVIQMPNGKGKTTIAEAIAALVSRDRRRLAVAQGRMAFRGSQMSHFRIELLKGSAADLVGIGGDPWVIGMAGNNVGPITFYTYHGTLEDVPIVKSLTSEQMMLASLEEIERAVTAKPAGDRSWNPDDEDWRSRLVGNRHLPRAALNEMARLQGMGGAEKAVRFFDIKATKEGERFDQAFFFNQIAPDLMNDLMTSEGEDQERRAAARYGVRYQPDNTFDKMVVNTLRSVTDAQYSIEARAETLGKWKTVATGLRAACAHADEVRAAQRDVQDIRSEMATNISVWWWLAANMSGWPSTEVPDGPLGTLCRHMGVLPGGEVVVRDSGMAFLLGRDVRHANEFLSSRKNIRPVSDAAKTQVIENACDIDPGPGGGKGSIDTRQWYAADEALRGLTVATSFGPGLDADAAGALLASAVEWAKASYFAANPLAWKVAQFQGELDRKKAGKAEEQARLQDRKAAAQRRMADAAAEIKRLGETTANTRRQVDDLNAYRRAEWTSPGDEPTEHAAKLATEYDTTVAAKQQLERRRTELTAQLNGLNQNQLVPDRHSSAVHERLHNASVRFSTVLQVLHASKTSLEAAGRWQEVCRVFANLLFAPVVDTPEIGKCASVALDKAPSLAFPVFIRDELLSVIMHGTIGHLPDMSYSHLAWGGVETATVRAFINPTETKELREAIIAEQAEVDDSLAALPHLPTIRERQNVAALAAKAIEADAEARLAEADLAKQDLERQWRANERESQAIEAILRGEEIPLRDDLANLEPIARGFWSKTRALAEMERYRQPWSTGADDIHKFTASSQRQFKRVLRVAHELGLGNVPIDAERDSAVQAAIKLKEAVSLCLRDGASLTAAISFMEAGLQGLDIADMRAAFRDATAREEVALSKMQAGVKSAVQGDAALTDMQRKFLTEEAQTPDGLLVATERFEAEIETDIDVNKRTREEAQQLEVRAINFLVGMISDVRSRLRLLQVALTDGEGAKFEVDCTLPDKDGLQKIFTQLMEVVRRTDREVRSSLGENASTAEVRSGADRILRKLIRDETKRQILLSPSVKVSHSAISGGRPVFLQDPDANNPNRFSGGENTAISLAWIIRRAKYASQKTAMRSRQPTTPESSFIVLDGLFSDLSDKHLISVAMAPLKMLGGQFQIIALVHPPEYLPKHDITIFPVLNIGRVHGDGWKMLHYDADKWEDEIKSKLGSIGVAHFSVLPAPPIQGKESAA